MAEGFLKNNNAMFGPFVLINKTPPQLWGESKSNGVKVILGIQ